MDDIKVKDCPGLYRRGAAIINKDCNYQSALSRLQKQKDDASLVERVTALESSIHEILTLLTQRG